MMEPRNGENRGQPTVASGWKAAVLGAFWRVCRTPPGSESGACLHRGHAGTWESHRSPCAHARTGGPGDQVLALSGRFAQAPGPVGNHDPGKQARYRGTSDQRGPRAGQGAVVAAQRTGESGAVRPTRPTGGTTASSRVSHGRETGERPRAHQPCHQYARDGGGSQRLGLRNRRRAWRTYGSVGGPDG